MYASLSDELKRRVDEETVVAEVLPLWRGLLGLGGGDSAAEVTLLGWCVEMYLAGYGEEMAEMLAAGVPAAEVAEAARVAHTREVIGAG